MQERMELTEIQNRIYCIFVEFDRICRKHGIKYSMEGGTLLGAVKYGDYVPWDDDIDVIMLREEYNKFLKVAPNELSEGFLLESYNNIPEFPLNYAKLCDVNTEIFDYSYSHLKKMNHGVFMDIFPIDNVDIKRLKKQINFVGLLTGARKTKLKLDLGNSSEVKKLAYKAVSLLPMKFICKMQNYVCCIYNKRRAEFRYEVCNPNSKFLPLPSCWYDDYVELNFRGKPFFALKNYDEFLKSRFGDNYMNELPGEAERKPSHGQNIRFVEGYKDE